MSESNGKSFELFTYAMPNIDNFYNSLLEKDYISTSSVMFKKNLYVNSNEKYNKSLTIECDRDLFLRLTGSSKVNFTNDCLVTRYLHNNSTSSIYNAASIKEFIALEVSINKFNSSKSNISLPSLEVFNSRISLLKGRHYWQLGDLKKARKSFSNAIGGKSLLLFLLTFVYPFKSNLRLIIYIFRHQKILFSKIREIKNLRNGKFK